MKLRSINLVSIIFILFLLFSQKTLAQRERLNSIYFNSDNSLVLEVDGVIDSKLVALTPVSENHYQVHLAKKYKLNSELETSIENSKFKVSVEKNNIGETVLNIVSQEKLENPVEVKTLFANHAYELSFKILEEKIPIPSNEWSLVYSQHNNTNSSDPTQLDELNFSDSPDSIDAGISSTAIYQFSTQKPSNEKFLASINPKLREQILQDPEYKNDLFKNIDSSSMEHLGKTLKSMGANIEALEAYRQAIEINPENLNARLGLALNTNQPEEKYINLLMTLNDQALESLAEIWFQEAKNSSQLKDLSKALLPYQILILKDPRNPSKRLKLAQIIEKQSNKLEFKQQALRRYLEAASLAKAQWLKGDKSIQAELIQASESLIRLSTELKNWDNAMRYIDSYYKLGFNKFSNGQDTLAIRNSISQFQNPFLTKSDLIGRKF